MNLLKRYLGIIWMGIGPVMLYILFSSAYTNIIKGGEAEINQPIPWIIIITIFSPVAAGLTVFGWYAWRGEYDERRDD